MNIHENEIIQKLKNGDEKVFKYVFESHYPVLVGFALKYIPDIDASKDIVQNFFISFFQKSAEIKINTSLKSYLYKSVYNRCLNQLKSEKIKQNHHKEILKTADVYSDNSFEIEQTEEEKRIYDAIETLPEQCKRIFKLNRFENKKNKEIAEELNLSIRTVETQISKALKTLREILKFVLFLIKI